MADPKGAQGAAKVPFRALPWAVIAEASLGMGEGAVKYGPHNWRSSGGVEAMTYVEGAIRHLTAFVLGEDTDAASGVSHVSKAISGLMILRDAQLNRACIDNRPPPVEAGFMDALNAQWAEVRARAGVEAARIAAASAAQPSPDLIAAAAVDPVGLPDLIGAGFAAEDWRSR